MHIRQGYSPEETKLLTNYFADKKCVSCSAPNIELLEDGPLRVSIGQISDGGESKQNFAEVKNNSGNILPSMSQRIERLCLVNEKIVSNAAFGALVGIAARSIGAYRTGTEPGAEALDKIQRATGCSAAWLLTGEGEPFPAAAPADPEAQARIDAMVSENATAATAALNAMAAAVPFLSDPIAAAAAIQKIGTAYALLGNALSTRKSQLSEKDE